MDVVDRATRSRMMSRIRGRDTEPEKLVRSFLHRAGLRFRLRITAEAGSRVSEASCSGVRSQLLLASACRLSACSDAIVYVGFWQAKFDANVARDKRVARQLRKEGWRVFVMWSCQIDESRMQSLSRKIREVIDGVSPGME